MVFYKYIWLAKNSKAYEIYHSKDDDRFRKLDKHLKEVEVRYKELLERY